MTFSRRITHSQSPYSFLQQRLQYVDQHPEKTWTLLVDNVPQWPHHLVLSNNIDQSFSTSYGPCNGYKSLINDICLRDAYHYSIKLSHENILITNGALHALSVILQKHQYHGTTALCQSPLLGSIADMLSSLGCTIRFFPPDLTDAEMLLPYCTDDVRLIYINTPHNPMGNIYSESVTKQLVELAERRKIPLIVDLAYDSFVFDEQPIYSPLLFSKKWHHIYTINSLSKNYGAPGLRIGWITSSSSNIADLAGKLERECIAVCGWAQMQASHLIQRGNQPLIERVIEGKAFIERWHSNQSRVKLFPAQGGTHYLAKLPVEDTEGFADYMLEAFGLALTTSSNYAGTHDSFIRIPLGYPLSTLQLGLTLLLDGLSTTSVSIRSI